MKVWWNISGLETYLAVKLCIQIMKYRKIKISWSCIEGLHSDAHTITRDFSLIAFRLLRYIHYTYLYTASNLQIVQKSNPNLASYEGTTRNIQQQ